MAEASTNNRRALDPVQASETYPKALRDAERTHRKHPRIGVALSGGGIRSATISLGFFQGLARAFLVRHIDFLSTVSGGGYFGGFFGHLLQRPTAAIGEYGKPERDAFEEIRKRALGDRDSRLGRETASADDAPTTGVPHVAARSLPDAVLLDPFSKAVGFLRENGRFLAPDGAGDLFKAGAIALRNWVSVIVVVGLLILAALSVLTLVRFGVEWTLLGTVVEMRLPVPWISSWFVAVVIAITFIAVPPGWAYWLVPDNDQTGPIRQFLARWFGPTAAVVAMGIAWYSADWALPAGPLARLAMAIGLIGGASFVLYVEARRRSAAERAESEPDRTERSAQEQRYAHSRSLAKSLVTVAALFGLAIVDSAGQWLAHVWSGGVAGAYAILVAAIGLARGPLLTFVSNRKAHAQTKVPTMVIANIAAVVVLLAFLGGLAAIPHLVALGGEPLPIRLPAEREGSTFTSLAALAAAAAVLSWIIGVVWPFVNRSSLHALYEARLRRAYLGASNPARFEESRDQKPTTEPHKDDGIAWDRYDPSVFGGPVHLINVTVNETIDGRSQVQQRDRKGMGMAIGPQGISVARRHHALWAAGPDSGVMRILQQRASGAWQGVKRALARLWPWGRTQALQAQESTAGAGPAGAAEPPKGFRVFPEKCFPEVLDPGQWIAISGGAVSTGLGARTSVGLSLLTGIFNIRLGYWWRSGVDPTERKAVIRRDDSPLGIAKLRDFFRVQSALLDEWFARFPGTARLDWNLTDGGHFENLGGYELIRRRLPLIIVCDNEQDANYGYSGLANLVRKARVDFGTEIRFLTDADLHPPQLLKTRVHIGMDAAASEAEAPAPRPRFPNCVGSLEALRRGFRSREDLPHHQGEKERIRIDGDKTGLSLVHAAIAEVHYPEAVFAGELVPKEIGLLLYVKPSLDGDEPVDLLHYHAEHPDFPHESTGDQFFDEPQWESYRRLGEHMAEKLFHSKDGLAHWIESTSDARASGRKKDQDDLRRPDSMG